MKVNYDLLREILIYIDEFASMEEPLLHEDIMENFENCSRCEIIACIQEGNNRNLITEIFDSNKLTGLSLKGRDFLAKIYSLKTWEEIMKILEPIDVMLFEYIEYLADKIIKRKIKEREVFSHRHCFRESIEPMSTGSESPKAITLEDLKREMCKMSNEIISRIEQDKERKQYGSGGITAKEMLDNPNTELRGGGVAFSTTSCGDNPNPSTELRGGGSLNGENNNL